MANIYGLVICRACYKKNERDIMWKNYSLIDCLVFNASGGVVYNYSLIDCLVFNASGGVVYDYSFSCIVTKHWTAIFASRICVQCYFLRRSETIMSTKTLNT